MKGFHVEITFMIGTRGFIDFLTSRSKSNSLKALFASFYRNTECLILDLCPEFLSGYVEGQWLQWLVTSSL